MHIIHEYVSNNPLIRAQRDSPMLSIRQQRAREEAEAAYENERVSEEGVGAGAGAGADLSNKPDAAGTDTPDKDKENSSSNYANTMNPSNDLTANTTTAAATSTSTTSSNSSDPLQEAALCASVNDFLAFYDEQRMHSLGGFILSEKRANKEKGIKSQAKPLTGRHAKKSSNSKTSHNKGKKSKPAVTYASTSSNDISSTFIAGSSSTGGTYSAGAVKAVLRPNQFFGETALLDSATGASSSTSTSTSGGGSSSGRRSASVYARTHVTLLCMNKANFLSLMELLEDPTAAV